MGRSGYEEYLRKKGFAQPAPSPVRRYAVPVFNPQDPVMPRDIAAGHNLPTTNARVISQMYGDTRQPTLPPVQARPGSYSPQERALDMFLSSPAAQNLDPAQLEQAVNRYRTPTVNPNQFPLDPFVDVAKAVADPISSIPVMPSIQTGPGGMPVSGPTTNVGDVAGAVNNLYAAPEQKWWEMQMDAGIYMAEHDGQMPTWVRLYYGDMPGQKWLNNVPQPTLGVGHDGWMPTLDPHMTTSSIVGNSEANNEWFLPSYLEAHPEDLETIRQIKADAVANGQDPTEAVSLWWTEKQGTLMNLVSRGLNDPVNLAGLAAAAGKGLQASSAASRAATGGSRLNTAAEAIGKALQVGGQIIDEPWELLRNKTGWGSRVPVPERDYVNDVPGGGDEILPTPNVDKDSGPGGAWFSPSDASEYHTADRSIENIMDRGRFAPPVDTSGLIGNGPTVTNPRSPTILDPGSWMPGIPGRGDGPAGINPINRTNQLLPGDGVRGALPTGPREDLRYQSAIPTLESPNQGRLFEPGSSYPSAGNVDSPRTVQPRVATQVNMNPRATQLAMDAAPPEAIIPEARSKGAVRKKADQLDLAPSTVALSPEPNVTAVTDVTDVTPTAATPSPATVTPPTAPKTVQTKLGSPPSYDAPGAPSFVNGAHPSNPTPGWSLTGEHTHGVPYVDQQIASKFGPEVSSAIAERIRPWMIDVYEPNHNLGRKISGWGGNGNVKITVNPALDGQAWVNMRISARMEGVPTEDLNWIVDPRYTNPLTAEQVAKGDFDKRFSLEAYYADLIFSKEPDPKKIAKLKSAGVIADTIGDNSKAAQEAFWRYTEAQRLREFIHATDAELDAMIARASQSIDPTTPIKPKDAPITAKEIKQVESLPTADELQPVNPYTASIVRMLDEGGPQFKAPVLAEVAPWAEHRLPDLHLRTRTTQTLTNLEYAGRMRVAILRNHGLDVNDYAHEFGRIDEAFDGISGTRPAESMSDFAGALDGTLPPTERPGRRFNMNDPRFSGKSAMDDFMSDPESWLEQLGFERKDSWRAKYESRAASLRRGAIINNTRKGVDLSSIGLDGWLYVDEGGMSEAIRVLDQAGFPREIVQETISKARRERLLYPDTALINRAILGTAEEASAARGMLYKRNYISSTPNEIPTSALGTADATAAQVQFSRNQEIWAIRTMIQGEAEKAITVADNFGRAMTRADWEKVKLANGKWQLENSVTGQIIGPVKQESIIDKHLANIPETPTGSYMDAPECFL